jgi:hypothetical protein
MCIRPFGPVACGRPLILSLLFVPNTYTTTLYITKTYTIIITTYVVYIVYYHC